MFVLYTIGDAPYGWVPYTGGDSNIIYVFTERVPPVATNGTYTTLPNLVPIRSYTTSNSANSYKTAPAAYRYTIGRVYNYSTNRVAALINRPALLIIPSSSVPNVFSAVRGLSSRANLSILQIYSTLSTINHFNTSRVMFGYTAPIENRQSMFIK